LMLELPKIPSSADLFSVDELAVLVKVGLPFSSVDEVKCARSFLQRYRLNPEIVKNRYWVYPVAAGALRFNELLLGRGVVGSEHCGQFISDYVCRNVEGHKGVMVGDVDCTNKIVVQHTHMFCHKATCPVCFYRGFSMRAARSVVGRLEAGVKRGFGRIEHFTVSPSVEDRDLPLDVLKKKIAAAAFDRGIVGFVMIPHVVRIDRVGKKLYRSVHAHLLGFDCGSADHCRNCLHDRGDCASCSGFRGKEVRGYRKDGYLVKVHDARKTVLGSVLYQVGHSVVQVGLKRRSLVTYWGVLACSKFKGGRLPVEFKCRACEGEMSRGVHVGRSVVVRDIHSPSYRSLVVMDEFDVFGNPEYVDVEGVGRNG
jgi:hypothetical protein